MIFLLSQTLKKCKIFPEHYPLKTIKNLHKFFHEHNVPLVLMLIIKSTLKSGIGSTESGLIIERKLLINMEPKTS
jgi:hypothetical protein